MKVFLDSIGCRLNQSEIERMALQFRAAGHELVDSAAEAELVVVNTCAVTTEAASDSRQKIRQAHRSGNAAIAATGCWATLDPQTAAALPNVEWVIPNQKKESLVAELLQIPVEMMDLEPLARQPLPGIHQRTRAFIKVQDGCDNFCTFCVTRLARGKGISLAAEQVTADVHRAIHGGAKEIVLTGVHLGSWGQDFSHPQKLKDLIETLLRESQMVRLRLSSLEPWDLDEDFFSLWRDERLCPHLHLPLQAGSGATLKRMARKVTPDSYSQLVEAARKVIPDLAITTDIIAGFPGESEAEFGETLEFVKLMDFAAGHVFTFSPRPGTAAAKLADPVAQPVKKARNAILRLVLTASSERFRQRFVGRKMGVLWETASGVGPDGWKLEGLTGNYLRVTARSFERQWNQVSQVVLTGAEADVLTGEIVL
jgi:threonylcarbamoyladenosine tRNA methylthiotransferase MtaB